MRDTSMKDTSKMHIAPKVPQNKESNCVQLHIKHPNTCVVRNARACLGWGRRLHRKREGRRSVRSLGVVGQPQLDVLLEGQVGEEVVRAEGAPRHRAAAAPPDGWTEPIH